MNQELMEKFDLLAELADDKSLNSSISKSPCERSNKIKSHLKIYRHSDFSGKNSNISPKKNSCFNNFYYNPKPLQKNNSKPLIFINKTINYRNSDNQIKDLNIIKKTKKFSCYNGFHYKNEEKKILFENKTIKKPILKKKENRSKSFFQQNNNISFDYSFQGSENPKTNSSKKSNLSRSKSKSISFNNSNNSVDILNMLKQIVTNKGNEPKKQSIKKNSSAILLDNSKNDTIPMSTTIMSSPIEKKNNKLKQKNNLISRLYEKHENSQLKIEKLRLEKEEQEKNQCTYTPDITNSTYKFTMVNKKPIYERTDEIKKKRADEIERIRNLIEIERSMKEEQPTFKPKLYKQTENLILKNHYEENQEWVQKKQKKLEKLTLHILQKDSENLSFHPKISNLSRKIAEKVKNNEKNKENFNQKEINKSNIIQIKKKKKKSKSKSRTPKLRDTNINISYNKTEKDIISKNRYNNNHNISDSQKKNKQNVFQKIFQISPNNNKNSSKSLKIKNKTTKIKKEEKSQSPSSSINKKKTIKQNKNPIQITPQKKINIINYEPNLKFLLSIFEKSKCYK